MSLGAWAEWAHGVVGATDARQQPQATTGTPRPRTLFAVAAGLLARGSRLSPGLPETLRVSVTHSGRKLAAHSCGGSPGLADRRTGFPLSPEPNAPREPRRPYLVGDSRSGRNGSCQACGGCTANQQQIHNTPRPFLRRCMAAAGETIPGVADRMKILRPLLSDQHSCGSP
jgi:hypothetical protein